MPWIDCPKCGEHYWQEYVDDSCPACGYNAQEPDEAKDAKQVSVLACPKCGSEKVSVVNAQYAHCDECGCSFLLNQSVHHTKDIRQANLLHLTDGNYKICPDCGSKMPIDAGQCPICGYTTFGESMKQGARNLGRGCALYAAFYIVGALLLILVLYILIFS